MWSPWERIDVSKWRLTGTETLGGEGAQWLAEPCEREDTPSGRWLHKFVRVHDAHVDGEDWAEVAATEIGNHLGILCTPTRLCVRAARQEEGLRNGSLSLRIHEPAIHDFREGGLFLADQGIVVADDVSDWPETAQRTFKRNHTLANIRTALVEVDPPRSFTGPPELEAFDVFAGYVCLDALVANRDRHEQNWAVLEPTVGDGPFELAPSFDHGSAFGYNLHPRRRSQMANHRDQLERWAAKGTAHRLQYTKPPPLRRTLVDAAVDALLLCTEQGRRHWQQVFVEGCDGQGLVEVLEPGIGAIAEASFEGLSDPASTFLSSLLEINLRRLRDAIRDL